MKLSSRGYTLVEILIVISVLGILVSIAMVSWGGYVNWSSDRARENDVRQWSTTFDLYKSRFIVYPAMPVDNSNPTVICLSAVGTLPTGASNTTGGNKCGLYTSGSANQYAWTANNIPTASPYAPFDFDTEVKRVGNMVRNSYEANGGSTVINNALVGPIAYISQTGAGSITVTAYLINFFKNGCPSTDFTAATSADFTPGSGKFAALSGLGTNPSGATTCYMQKNTFTYSPS